MTEPTNPPVSQPWAPAAPATAETPPVVPATDTPAAPTETDPATETQTPDASSPTVAPNLPEGSLEIAGEEVTVTVPKGFKLQFDYNILLDIKAGVQPMKRAVAEHWYAKANGVTIYNP